MKANSILFNENWAMTETAVKVFLEDIQAEEFNPEGVLKMAGELDDNASDVVRRKQTAILPVYGPIMRRSSFLSFFFRIAAIEKLALDLNALLADKSVKRIVLDIDSPGGQVTGVNEFAQQVYYGRRQKEIVAYTGGDMASAAYWIGTAANRIVADATARVGSIGVVVTVFRKNKNQIEIVSTKSPKKRMDPETEEGQAAILEVADEIAEKFIKDVARNRGVSSVTVEREFGQGGILVGRKALKAGMVDRLGNLESLLI